jgi:hypothetical protein
MELVRSPIIDKLNLPSNIYVLNVGPKNRKYDMGILDGFFGLSSAKKGNNKKSGGDKGGGKSHNDHRDKSHDGQKETHTKSSPGRSSGKPGRGGNR